MSWKTYRFSSILCILGLGGTLQGFETSSMAVFIDSDQFKVYFNKPDALAQGIIAGSHSFGAFFGCWIAGSVSDKFGRVRALQVGASFWITGSLISVFVQDLFMLIAGRGFKGIAVGVFSATLPVYISEIMPAHKKGLATSVLQWCLTCGILIMFYLSYACSFIKEDVSFRTAWGVEMLPGTLLLLFSFLLPESPKWYASKARWSEASNVLTNLELKYEKKKPTEQQQQEQQQQQQQQQRQQRQQQQNIAGIETPETENNESPDSDSNLKVIEGVLDQFENQSRKCTYADLFKRDLRTHLIIGILTQSITQLSGISVLMYYLIFICEMVGLSGDVKVLSASIQYVINVLFTVFPIMWLDKLRRKDVMVYGSGSLGLCIGAIGSIMGYYGQEVPPINGNESIVWKISGTPGSLCLALCFLFVAIFASTLSCAAWLYTNEIFPDRAKAKGAAICMSFSWTLNFSLTFLAPLCLKHFKWVTFLIFAICCIVGAFIIGFFFPETYGLTPHEISKLFQHKKQKDIELQDHPINNPMAIASQNENDDLLSRSVRSRASKVSKASSKSQSPPALHSTVKISEPTDLQFNRELIRVIESESPNRSLSLKHGFSLDTSNTFRTIENGISPFLKKMGAPFDTPPIDHDTNVDSLGNSELYYNNSVDGTPFLNFYNDSPFK